jgi:hypothetical protein
MTKRLGFIVVVIGVALAGHSRSAAAQATTASVSASPAAAATHVSDTAQYREVQIPAGTRIGVRLNTGVSSRSPIEQPVDATVIAPLKIRGAQVVPAGSEVKGDVVAAQRSGKVKGRARLAIRFRTLTVGSQSYAINAQVARVAPATKKKDAEEIGIPAAGGAVIGALVGGGKGAAIGAAAGGGAGTAVVLSTPGKEVALPKGSVVALRLQRAVTVRVPLK